MQKAHFEVENLANEQGKTQMKNALDKVKGIQKVRISVPAGTIDVEYNEPADKSQIRHCIEHTGFSVT